MELTSPHFPLQPPPDRLLDLIQAAFDDACDQRDVEIADCLVGILDIVTGRPPQAAGAAGQRKIVTNFKAHERLWRLRREAAGLSAPPPQGRCTNGGATGPGGD